MIVFSQLNTGSRNFIPFGKVMRISASKKKKKTMGVITATGMVTLHL